MTTIAWTCKYVTLLCVQCFSSSNVDVDKFSNDAKLKPLNQWLQCRTIKKSTCNILHRTEFCYNYKWRRIGYRKE